MVALNSTISAIRLIPTRKGEVVTLYKKEKKLILNINKRQVKSKRVEK